MIKLMFLLTMTMSPSFTQAQVNTGGPDFAKLETSINTGGPDFSKFDVAVIENLNYITKIEGDPVPAVLHDPITKQFKALMSDDLEVIYMAFKPTSIAQLVQLLDDSHYFISTMVRTYWGYQTPSLKIDFHEVYNSEVGYMIPIVSAEGGWTDEDVKEVFKKTHMIFGGKSPMVIYAPVKSPVW